MFYLVFIVVKQNTKGQNISYFGSLVQYMYTKAKQRYARIRATEYTRARNGTRTKVYTQRSKYSSRNVLDVIWINILV